MKDLRLTKQVLLLLLMIIGSSLRAQVEFAPIGAEWYYDYNSFWIKGYTHIRSETDTIIDGIICKKIAKSRQVYNSVTQDSMHYTIGYEYMTQFNDSVMVYRYGKLIKLYDFNSEIGDTITFPGSNNYMTDSELMFGKAIVIGKGTINIDGNELKYIDIENLNETPWGFSSYGFNNNIYATRICEKIGNLYGYLLPEFFYVSDNEEGGSLRCYSDDNISQSFTDKQCDYISSTVSINETIIKDVEIYPNPTEGNVTIELTQDNNSITIYDSYGRNIYTYQTTNNLVNIDISNYPSGIYLISITNGVDSYLQRIIKR